MSTGQRRRGLTVASLLLAVAAWTGCDEQPAPSASTPTTPLVANDSAAAYAVLSAALERCDDGYDSCIDAASGTKAQCDSDRDACHRQSAATEADARKKLEHEAHHCRAVCEEDAGPGDEDAGSGDMNECLGHHAPKLPRCVAGLFSCLADAGAFKRDATGNEIRGCVHEAHSCIVDELRELRERRHHHHGSDMAGAAAPGGAGGSGGSGGSATGGKGGSGGSTSTGMGMAFPDAGARNQDADDKNDENDRGRRHRGFGFGGWWHF